MRKENDEQFAHNSNSHGPNRRECRRSVLAPSGQRHGIATPVIQHLKHLAATVFRWQRGRQLSGYDKMLILESYWPLPFDVYILRYPEGSEVAPHTDPVTRGDHYRLNIVVKRANEGGEFHCSKALFESARIKYFRPDAAEHSVSKVIRGRRYVLSVGWVRNR
jgi:hypothetical protein